MELCDKGMELWDKGMVDLQGYRTRAWDKGMGKGHEVGTCGKSMG